MGHRQPLSQPEPASPQRLWLPAPTAGAPQAPAPRSPDAPGGSPNLQLDLSADHPQVQQGDKMMYKIEVSNNGSATAPAWWSPTICPRA